MAIHICPICGIEFKYPRRSRTYCSRQCQYEAQRRVGKRVEAACEFCGKPFISPDASNWATHQQQRFCSEICKGKGIAARRGLRIRQKTAFTCRNCGVVFTRIARADRTYLYCSRKCFWANHRGPNHHCWQGGTDRYYGPNWNEQRDKALERDGYTCQICGTKEDGINVHHITLRSDFGQDWEAMNTLSNLISLCHSCHGKLHMEQRNASR